MTASARSRNPKAAHELKSLDRDFTAESPVVPLVECDFVSLEGRDSIVVDVRSPAEFEEDHIPGARSVPLFTDSERAVVGTLYRQVGPERAREWGQDRVGARLTSFVRSLEEAFELPSSTSEVASDPLRVVACARGGVRSAAVARLLVQHGYAVSRLRGGYRAYRTRIRERLGEVSVPKAIAIHGLTGVGKTRVLREIESLRPKSTLDLEQIAGHRSSVLGDLGLQPVSQKRFESRLAHRIGQLEGLVFTEWEGAKIGNRQLPSSVFQSLWGAIHVELRATDEQRVDLLVDEYLGAASVEEICERLASLERFDAFGAQGVRELSDRLRAGDRSFVVRELLARHYDPRYLHSQRRFTMSEVFRLQDPRVTAREIVEWAESGGRALIESPKPRSAEC